jgi:hypothetical protein
VNSGTHTGIPSRVHSAWNIELCCKLLHLYPRVVQLNSMVVLFLIFCRNFILNPIVAMLICTIQCVSICFGFDSQNLLSLVTAILHGVRWNHDGVLMSFLWKLIFHVFIDHFYFFWELSLQSVCPLIDWIICFLGVNCLSLSDLRVFLWYS